MPQYSFTCDTEFISIIDGLAVNESRSRSEIINILLKIGLKEKTRNRSGKKNNSQHNTSDPC